MAPSRITLTTAVAQRLCLTLLAPLVHRAVTLALMGSLAVGGFIAAPSPASAEPEWALLVGVGSEKDSEGAGRPASSSHPPPV